MGLLVS